MPSPLEVIVDFLRTVGIATAEGSVPAGSFLPGIRVAGGTIVYDRATLRWPGDLLHEAGPLAVLPAAMRSRLDDALPGIDDIPHAGEAEAPAWAYAAIVHLGLDPAVLFHEGGYRGRSTDLIRTFGYGAYPGAYGLSQAG